MNRISALFAACTIAACGTTAEAADIVIPPPSPPPIIRPAPAFIGPYWGVYAGAAFGLPNSPDIMLGTQFGYNFGRGSLRAGLEVETEYWGVLPSLIDASLNARAGLAIGNRALLYAQAGIGTYSPVPVWNIGGGVEIMLGSGLALFAEAKRFGAVGGGAPQALSIRGGLNYYAGNDNHDPAGVFDWGGLYLGAFGGGVWTSGLTYGLVGANVGYNFTPGGSLIVGVDVETHHLIVPVAVLQATLNGRIGVTLGRVLVYGEIGIGTFTGGAIWTAGGGAEFALGNRIGLFAEGKAIFAFPGPPGLGGVQLIGGLNIHFGR